MPDAKTQKKRVQLILRDEALREALAAAFGGCGFSIVETGANALALDAGGDEANAITLAALAPGALQAILAFSTQASQTQRSIILVAGAEGPAREALNGGVRALARSLAPGLRVNALTPLHAGEAIDTEQAAIAAAYLANAGAVTGQIIEIAARKSAS